MNASRRRVKAVFEFAFGVFLCYFVFWFRNFRYEHSDEAPVNRLEPFSPVSVLTGAATSIAIVWCSDTDVLGVRTNRRRRLLFGVGRSGAGRILKRFAPGSSEYNDSYNLGTALGIVVYRFWYGILHPLPGDD